MTLSTTRIVFLAVFLAVVVGLTVAMAGGSLRFGFEGPVVFVFYVLAGLVAALVCFWLLSSTGEVEGSQGGFVVRFGGAITALVLVAGGGSLYELKVRKPASSFDARIVFYAADKTRPEPINGTFTLFWGVQQNVTKIQNLNSIVIQGLPRELVGKSPDVALDAINWEIDTAIALPQLTNESPVYVKVRRKAPFEPPDTAVMKLYFSRALHTTMARDTQSSYLTVILQAHSFANATIPLASEAEVFFPAAASIEPIKLTINSEDRGVPAQSVIDIAYEGKISKKTLAMLLQRQLDAEFRVRYDPQRQQSDVYYSTVFRFDSSNVKE